MPGFYSWFYTRKTGKNLFAIIRGTAAICSIAIGVYRFRAIVSLFENYNGLWAILAGIVDLLYKPILAIGVFFLIGYLVFPKIYLEDKNEL